MPGCAGRAVLLERGLAFDFAVQLVENGDLRFGEGDLAGSALPSRACTSCRMTQAALAAIAVSFISASAVSS